MYFLYGTVLLRTPCDRAVRTDGSVLHQSPENAFLPVATPLCPTAHTMTASNLQDDRSALCPATALPAVLDWASFQVYSSRGRNHSHVLPLGMGSKWVTCPEVLAVIPSFNLSFVLHLLPLLSFSLFFFSLFSPLLISEDSWEFSATNTLESWENLDEMT